jgi:hypothetical protein
MSLLLVILIVLVVLSAGGGVWGHSKWGWRGYSPVGLLFTILLIVLLVKAFSNN